MSVPPQRSSSIVNRAGFVAATIGTIGDVVRRDGAVLVSSPVPVANGFVNAAFPVDPGADRDAFLDAATTYFGSRGTPFVVCADGTDRALQDAAVERGGVVDHDPAPDMWIDHPVARSADLIVRLVEDADGFEDCARLGEQGYGIEGMARLMQHHRMIDAEGVRWVVALDGGTPVGTACGFLDDRVGGIYYVATPPQFARRGVATAVTASLVNGLLADGADSVVLQASAAGRPVYERLGFSTRGRLTEYRFEVAAGV